MIAIPRNLDEALNDLQARLALAHDEMKKLRIATNDQLYVLNQRIERVEKPARRRKGVRGNGVRRKGGESKGAT